MSFILDALRRAQHAHESPPVQSAPIYADRVPEAPADYRRRAVWLLGAVAAFAIVAAASWWFGRTSVPAPATTRNTAPAPTPAPPVTRPAEPQGNTVRAPVRALDQEVARARPAPAPAPASAPPRPERSRVTPGTVTVSPAPTATSPAAADNTDVAALPQYENLLVEGAINLPNLKMDMHVYNRTPSKRFVFINFKKYREGDALDRQTSIEEITTTGAVMNHKGQRFLLRPN